MKKIFYVLVIGFVTHSCTQEVAVIQNEAPMAVKVSEKRAVANKSYIASSSENGDKFRITEGVAPTPKLFRLYSELNLETMEGDWQTVHEIAKKGLLPVLHDDTYVFDTQAISYKVLHSKLLLENENSPELEEAILFYFTALMDTKAEDLGVLTLTMQRISNSIEPKLLTTYQNYLLTRADKDLLKYEPLLEAKKQKLQNSSDEDYEIRRHIVGYQNRVDDAKLAIRIFRNS